MLGSRIDAVILPKSPTETTEEGYVPQSAHGLADAPTTSKPRLRGSLTSNTRSTASRLPAHSSPKLTASSDVYISLLGLLKSVKGDPERMRELIYRVSWPQKSKVVDGMTFHRITTWAALQIQLQLVVQTGMRSSTTETEATQVIRFEFDHSTDFERRTHLTAPNSSHI